MDFAQFVVDVEDNDALVGDGRVPQYCASTAAVDRLVRGVILV